MHVDKIETAINGNKCRCGDEDDDDEEGSGETQENASYTLDEILNLYNFISSLFFSSAPLFLCVCCNLIFRIPTG